jgi:hypothetical protein
VGLRLNLVLLNYAWNQADTALPIPHDVLMTLSYCKSPANPETAGNPHIFCLFSGTNEVNVQKTGRRRAKDYPQVKSFSTLVCNL